MHNPHVNTIMNTKPQSSLTGVMKTAFGELMKNVATSIPGHILGFDSARQTAQVQIGIVTVKVNGDTFTPPPLIECPVYFPGGTNFFIEYQINNGDEGWILFSQSCIDAWAQTGGIAQNPILRMHDESDGCFFPGFRPATKSISDFKNEGIRIRNLTGDSHVWLKNDSVVIQAENVSILSNSFTHNGVNISSTHTHPQGADSHGDAQQDTGGPK